MIRNLIQWWILGKINSLLEEYKDNVTLVKTTLRLWIERIEKILKVFKDTISKLEDNKLTDDEIDDIEEEIAKLVKEWK